MTTKRREAYYYTILLLVVVSGGMVHCWEWWEKKKREKRKEKIYWTDRRGYWCPLRTDAFPSSLIVTSINRGSETRRRTTILLGKRAVFDADEQWWYWSKIAVENRLSVSTKIKAMAIASSDCVNLLIGEMSAKCWRPHSFCFRRPSFDEAVEH